MGVRSRITSRLKGQNVVIYFLGKKSGLSNLKDTTILQSLLGNSFTFLISSFPNYQTSRTFLLFQAACWVPCLGLCPNSWDTCSKLPGSAVFFQMNQNSCSIILEPSNLVREGKPLCTPRGVYVCALQDSDG